MKALHLDDVIAAAEATGTYHGDLRRAMDEAPKLLIAGGLSQPFNTDLRYDGYQATDHVLSDSARAESAEAAAELTSAGAQLQVDVTALVHTFANPRIDAAYALGLAVGLTFGRLVDRGAAPGEEV